MKKTNKIYNTLLIICSLLFKYLVLYTMNKFFNLKEWDIYLRLLIALSLPVIDLIILYKNREFILYTGISVYKHFLNYIFWHILIIDSSIPISAVLGKKISNIFIEIGIILCMLYIMIDLVLLPFKMSRWEKGSKTFPIKEKIKIILLYYIIPLYVFYKVLASSEDILLPLFSGVIVVFYKWFYSKEFLIYNKKKEKEFYNLIDSETIEMLFQKKIGNVTIMLIAMNIVYLLKKVFLKEITSKTMWLIKILNWNLDYNIILNLFVTILACILATVIYIIINKRGTLYIKENYETIVGEKSFQNKKRKRLNKLKHYNKYMNKR